MLRRFHLVSPFALVLAASLLVFGVVGCTQLSPEEKIDARRAEYTAEAQSFRVREVAPEPITDSESGSETETDTGDADAAEEPAEDSAEDLAPTEPPRKEILLDVLVGTETNDPLPGLTLDITLVDAGGSEKARWQRHVDTSSIVRGSGEQMTIVLEDVDWVEGDQWSAEVRVPVPAAERSAYPEFAGATS